MPEGQASGMRGAAGDDRDRVISVVLRDVHPLHGGQNLYLRGDGSGFVQIVSRNPDASGLHEKRFRMALAPEVVGRLEQTLKEHFFFEIAIKERPGMPGEARPRISVVLNSRKSLTVAKWFRDKHPGFDAIYSALMEQVRAVGRGQPVQAGKFDPLWIPEGFPSP